MLSQHQAEASNGYTWYDRLAQMQEETHALLGQIAQRNQVFESLDAPYDEGALVQSMEQPATDVFVNSSQNRDSTDKSPHSTKDRVSKTLWAQLEEMRRGLKESTANIQTTEVMEVGGAQMHDDGKGEGYQDTKSRDLYLGRRWDVDEKSEPENVGQIMHIKQRDINHKTYISRARQTTPKTLTRPEDLVQAEEKRLKKFREVLQKNKQKEIERLIHNERILKERGFANSSDKRNTKEKGDRSKK